MHFKAYDYKLQLRRAQQPIFVGVQWLKFHGMIATNLILGFTWVHSGKKQHTTLDYITCIGVRDPCVGSKGRDNLFSHYLPISF